MLYLIFPFYSDFLKEPRLLIQYKGLELSVNSPIPFSSSLGLFFLFWGVLDEQLNS